jgi:hypothetical protein
MIFEGNQIDESDFYGSIILLEYPEMRMDAMLDGEGMRVAIC